MSVTGVCGPVRAADVHLDRLLETAQTQTVRSCEGTGARRHGWLDTRDEDVLEPGFREKGCEGCQGLGRVIFAATRTGQLSRHCLPEFGRCTRAKSTATNAWEGIMTDYPSYPKAHGVSHSNRAYVTTTRSQCR